MIDILINIASLCFWFALATSGIAAAVISLVMLIGFTCVITGSLISAIGKRRK